MSCTFGKVKVRGMLMGCWREFTFLFFEAV